MVCYRTIIIFSKNHFMNIKLSLFAALLILLSLSNCADPSDLTVTIKDDISIGKIYLYKDLMLTQVEDSSSSINGVFNFKLNFGKTDLHFISEYKHTSDAKYQKTPKYFCQFIFEKGEKIEVTLLPKLKYEITGKLNRELNEIYSNQEKVKSDSSYLDNIIISHAKNQISPFILYYVSLIISNERFLDYVTKIDTSILNSTYYGREIVTISESLMRKNLPENIKIADARGKERELSTMAGKITSIDNWASWCAPCITEMPEMIKLYHRVKSNAKIRFVAISSDKEKENWAHFAKKMEIPFESYIIKEESKKDYYKYYNIKAIPFGILIDEKGAIITSVISSAIELKRELAKLGIKEINTKFYLS